MIICASLPVSAPPVLFHTPAQKFLNLSQPDNLCSDVELGAAIFSAEPLGVAGLDKCPATKPPSLLIPYAASPLSCFLVSSERPVFPISLSASPVAADYPYYNAPYIF